MFGTARLATEKAVIRPALPLAILPVLNGTDMDVKPIETEYAGHLFRSRLEARWAVFFDHLGLEWKYESHGFEGGAGRYLPDFHLPSLGVWCEVKGDPDALGGAYERMIAVLKPGGPLPLLLLGDIPSASEAMVLHPILYHSESLGLCRTEAVLIGLRGEGNRIEIGYEDSPDVGPRAAWFRAALGFKAFVGMEKSFAAREWRVESSVRRDCSFFPLVCDAYRAARQARFEHGQKGAL